MHNDIGLNFAAALRAFLRQDPDVIMVGEIRDFETPRSESRRRFTGHLVLSTLHTNDAPSTVNRLSTGGRAVSRASSVKLIMAQRLVRVNLLATARKSTSSPPRPSRRSGDGRALHRSSGGRLRELRGDELQGPRRAVTR